MMRRTTIFPKMTKFKRQQQIQKLTAPACQLDIIWKKLNRLKDEIPVKDRPFRKTDD